MTAFVAFIKTFAVWLYIFCGVGILVGVKMLMDARYLARTTLFSLDQERAGEQYYRGIALILFLILMACAVTGVNLFVSPIVPAAEPPIVRVPTATFVVTFSAPTPIPPTNTLPPTRAAETSAVINPSPAIVAPTRTQTKPPPPPPSLIPFALPAPIVKGPVPNGGAWTGENQAVNNLVFRWEWNCDQCVLGPSDQFFVLVSFTDKNTGAPRSVGGTTREKFLSMATIVTGAGVEVWHQAKEDFYAWYVQVRRGDQPLTPPSETWKFYWH